MKRSVIITLLGFLFYLNPLIAVNKNFESNTCQDSIENLRNIIESQQKELMLMDLERQKIILDIQINEQKETLFKYKIIVYSTITFSILMTGLTVVLFLKIRNKKKGTK